MDKSQLRVRPGFLLGLFVVFVIIPLLAAMILPLLADGRPRGNRENLTYIRHQIEMWKRQTTNNTVFDFSKLSNDDKQETFWLRFFDCQIKTNFSWQNDNTKREIVIVSDQEFGNVHKPGFWNSFFNNPAHAAGYSDRTVGLISPTEFSNLNLNGFVSLSKLATNSDFNNFKK